VPPTAGSVTVAVRHIGDTPTRGNEARKASHADCYGPAMPTDEDRKFLETLGAISPVGRLPPGARMQMRTAPGRAEAQRASLARLAADGLVTFSEVDVGAVEITLTEAGWDLIE
jgi:hypothetical protein